MAMWKKIVIAVAGLLVVLFIGLLVVAKVMITPERVRASVVPLVAESLQRELKMGDIEISLFSGIVLKDLELADREGKKPFVAVDRAVLRYSLWALLTLRVEVEELRLERPQINIIRYKDGTFNFSDMAGQNGEGDAPAPSQATAEGGGAPVAVHVSEIVISNGTVVYTDLGAGKKGQHTVSAFNLAVHDFSTTEPFAMTLSTDWNGNALALDGRFDLDDRSVVSTFGLNKIAVQLTGDLLADAKGDRLRARVEMPTTSVADLIASLPQGMVDLGTLPELSGRLALELVLDGQLAEPEKLLRSGAFTFDGMTIKSDRLATELNGRILLDRLALSTEKLQVKLNGQALSVSARIADLLRQPQQVDLTLRASRFDLDRVLPQAPDETGEKQAEKPVASGEPAVEVGPFDIPIDLTALATFDELVYHKLPLKKAELRLNLKNNLLTIERLTAGIGSGSFEQSGKVNLGVRGLNYSAKTTLKQLPANPIARALQPKLSESIFGTVDGVVDLNGAGTVPEKLKKRLSGKGALVLKEAKLTSMPALDSTAGLLGVADLKEIVIDEGDATFRIMNGTVAVNLKTIGPQLGLVTKGNVSLSGLLGLNVDISLAPPLAKRLDRRGALGGVLTDQKGWTHVPLKVKGDYASPTVKLDMQAISKRATEGAADKLKEKLRKKLGGDSDKQKDDPASRLIDGAIKGLLGN